MYLFLTSGTKWGMRRPPSDARPSKTASSKVISRKAPRVLRNNILLDSPCCGGRGAVRKGRSGRNHGSGNGNARAHEDPCIQKQIDAREKIRKTFTDEIKDVCTLFHSIFPFFLCHLPNFCHCCVNSVAWCISRSPSPPPPDPCRLIQLAACCQELRLQFTDKENEKFRARPLLVFPSPQQNMRRKIRRRFSQFLREPVVACNRIWVLWRLY